MKILPPQTKPPTSPIERRHRPRPVHGRQGYLKFRPCLRWDFGFTCPFCLMHESDFVRGGCVENSRFATNDGPNSAGCSVLHHQQMHIPRAMHPRGQFQFDIPRLAGAGHQHHV